MEFQPVLNRGIYRAVEVLKECIGSRDNLVYASDRMDWSRKFATHPAEWNFAPELDDSPNTAGKFSYLGRDSIGSDKYPDGVHLQFQVTYEKHPHIFVPLGFVDELSDFQCLSRSLDGIRAETDAESVGKAKLILSAADLKAESNRKNLELILSKFK